MLTIKLSEMKSAGILSENQTQKISDMARANNQSLGCVVFDLVKKGLEVAKSEKSPPV